MHFFDHKVLQGSLEVSPKYPGSTTDHKSYHLSGPCSMRAYIYMHACMHRSENRTKAPCYSSLARKKIDICKVLGQVNNRRVSQNIQRLICSSSITWSPSDTPNIFVILRDEITGVNPHQFLMTPSASII